MDLNLLLALDALLEEGSVTGAAERLRTSAPAMSRTLGRLRRVLGDPVLVRAGRGLVPTPRAVELRESVRAVVEQAKALLAPAPVADLGGLRRTFALQTGDLLASRLAGRLLERAHAVAPHVVFRFLPDSLEGTPALREGRVDLEIGVLDHVDPETRVEPLLTTRMVGAVRPSHPLARGRVTVRRFAAAAHVTVSRRGRLSGPVDEVLARQGLSRRVVASVPSYSAALSLAAVHDVVTLAPAGTPFPGLTTFEIPLDLPAVSIGMAWHPRNDADAAHRWLRGLVREVLVGDEGGH
ncbi:LysR family transcriptional regulator [Saccharothrix variisporea]|uniref:LysR family transcriptional regulator n=1 Tax=Saccharothrix variisporea TaxID=543527 RepID=A0A495X4H1_9PSEU|nr:LysR family transcriptional regulator [Saccharothrix variisporea]RKT68446.1 LysR family transcriptional regulator [Saccharothrix variisporea]